MSILDCALVTGLMGGMGQTVRVIDLETGGPAVTDVCEIGWQDVEQGVDGTWRLAGEGGARFVNPGRPISPDTMAVHHILDAWVADAPFWAGVAPEVLGAFPDRVALAAHRAGFEQRHCLPRYTGGASWICTWKCAIRLWPELPRFSNQMLRYLRRPEGLDHERGLPAHRGFPDAYVTAHHLRDMLNAASLETLLEWSRLPGLLPRAPSGPDRGKRWADLSDASLATFEKDRDLDIRFTATTERERRGSAATPTMSPTRQGSLL